MGNALFIVLIAVAAGVAAAVALRTSRHGSPPSSRSATDIDYSAGGGTSPDWSSPSSSGDYGSPSDGGGGWGGGGGDGGGGGSSN